METSRQQSRLSIPNPYRSPVVLRTGGCELAVKHRATNGGEIKVGSVCSQDLTIRLSAKDA